MKNTIEDKLKRIRIWSWITALVIVVGGVVTVYLTPALRYGQITFDREEAEQLSKEVRERAEARHEQQEKERAERRLSEEHAKRLVEEAEKKERDEIVRQLREVRELQKRLDRENQIRREEIEKQNTAQRMDKQMDPLRKNLERTLEAIETLKEQESEKPLPEPYAEHLDAKQEALKKLLEDVKQGYEKESLAEITEEALQLAQETADFKPEEDEALNRHRNELLSAANDTVNDTAQLIEEAAAMATSAESPTEATATSNATPEASPPIEALINPDGKSVAELYEAAQEVEAQLNDSLDESRATELANRQNSSVEEARSKLIASSNKLEDLPALSQPALPGTIGELSQRREDVAEAARRIDQFHSRATEASRQREMLASGSERPSVISTSNALPQALRNQINDAAQRKQNGSLNDMSGLMRLASGSINGDAGHGSEDRSVRNDEESIKQNATHSTNPPKLNTSNITANALPGRRFSEASAREGWLYLDTWYVIGPWNNKGDLSSFNIPHPPESEIDFDGVYAGKTYSRSDASRDTKQGIERRYTPNEPRPLRWNFIQSDSIRIDIPDETSDATYYLYTDVFFEEGRDMLLAIGSDDAAKVWINGIVVWLDQDLSSWKLGENFSKVFFKQGYNSILVRLENGPSLCELSFLICPPTL